PGGDSGGRSRGNRRRRQGCREGDGTSDAAVQRKSRRQGHQPDRPRGAAGGLMSQADLMPSHGGPAQMQGGAPVALPEGHVADAWETIECEPVLQIVASYTAGPLGRARALARRPTDDIAWIGVELERAGEVAGLFRRGDRLLAEAIPDVTQPLARLRIE